MQQCRLFGAYKDVFRDVSAIYTTYPTKLMCRRPANFLRCLRNMRLTGLYGTYVRKTRKNHLSVNIICWAVSILL